MSTTKRNRTILVVDDEKSDREAARRLLKECGYEVLEAADYWEAVKAFEQHRNGIDLLLTAIALPGNNGYELATTLFRSAPNLKVLFVSGRTGAEVSRFYNMPVSGHHILAKPVQPADLLDRVRHILSSRKKLPHSRGAPGAS